MTLEISTSLLIFGAGMLAGILNGVAGGGGLIGFPTLLLTGVQPINANATNAAALWLGTVASTVAYRQELSSQRRKLFLLSLISVIGGTLGSYVLLHTSQTSFAALIPYLLLIATLLFTVSQPLTTWLRSHGKKRYLRLPMSIILLLQLAIAIYGGFFGGGGGILMLALLNLMGIKNVHVMNAFKSWLATCMNAAALVYFIAAGAIVWLQAILMASGALLGGYGSAYFARQIHPSWVRYFVISVGFTMTGYFFLYKAS
ncbi:MAG: sulfite exporter TauE/SafE family protein [Aphanothece sp. CMT-3BRIN-NPC111]|jgi:hypothetical protein|nr:sulfite exporter TauE/SafE family protein [Aphanothece sp. CMT-3BRIN-NPC111]